MASMHLFAGRFVRRAVIFIPCLLTLQAVALASDELLWMRRGDNNIADLKCSPDGGTLYSANMSPAHVKKWEEGSDSFLTWWSSMYPLRAMDISPDGQVIALVGSRLEYISASTGRMFASFYSGSQEYQTVDFAPNGSFLLLGSGHQIRMTHPGSNSNLRTYNLWYSFLEDVAIAPDSRSFVACGSGYLSFWSITGTAPLSVQYDQAHSTAFSSDGTLLATGHAAGRVTIWHYPTKRRIRTLYANPAARVCRLVFDEVGGNILALQQGDQFFAGDNLYAWRLSTLEPAFVRSVGYQATALLAPSTGDSIYVSSILNGAMALNRQSGDLERGVSLNVGSGAHVKFAVDDSMIASASHNVNDYRTLRKSDGALVWSKRVPGGIYAPLAVSRDGTRLAIRDLETLRIVDAASGAVLHSVRHRNKFRSVAFSPNGRQLAFTDSFFSSPHRIFVWDLDSGPISTITVNPQANDGEVEFTPDGNYLVASMSQGWINVYRTDTWQLHASVRFDIHHSGGPDFEISPNGAYLAASYALYPLYGVKILRLSDLSEVSTVPAGYHSDIEFSSSSDVLWIAHNRISAYRVGDTQLLYQSSHSEVQQVYRLAVSALSGDVAFYRADGSQGLLRNPLR